jgi:preprotein translocase subunit SecG
MPPQVAAGVSAAKSQTAENALARMSWLTAAMAVFMLFLFFALEVIFRAPREKPPLFLANGMMHGSDRSHARSARDES